MRTNKEMRERAVRGIKLFFQSAINNLNKPDDITDLLANHCEEHRKDEENHLQHGATDTPQGSLPALVARDE